MIHFIDENTKTQRIKQMINITFCKQNCKLNQVNCTLYHHQNRHFSTEKHRPLKASRIFQGAQDKSTITGAIKLD